MPTFSSIYYPRPTDWQKFETIVLDASKVRFNSHDCQKNGRQGQKQDGVDIILKPDKGGYVGIQCKLTFRDIDINLVKKEINHAEGFKPPLDHLYIATTLPHDSRLQEEVRIISDSREKQSCFKVSMLFWGDVTNNLADKPDLLQKHYPSFFNAKNSENLYETLRGRDIRNVEELLSYIDVDSIPYQIEMAPGRVVCDFFEAEDCFNYMQSQPSFRFNDKELGSHVISWINKFREIVNLGRYKYFIPDNPSLFQGGICYVNYRMNGDEFCSNEDKEVYYALRGMYKEFKCIFQNFVNFMHENYSEIDIKSLSDKARKWQYDIDSYSKPLSE